MVTAKVIDADGHVRDRDADVRPFIEEPYCRRQGALVPGGWAERTRRRLAAGG